MLSPRTTGAESVDAQIRGVDFDRLGFIGFSQNRHGASAGVYASLGFGGWHTLNTMAAGLELQSTINPNPLDADHHLFVATQFTDGFADDFHTPTLVGAITGVHAQQIPRKQGRFIATRASADFQKRVTGVVGVFGQQHALQLRFNCQNGRLCAGNFFLCHGLQFWVSFLQHGLSSCQILHEVLPFLVRRDQGHHLGVFARQGHELCHVFHDVFAGQQKIQLGQTLNRAL